MAVAAVAMAASLFAADVSAGTKIKGDIFGLDKDGNISVLKQTNDSHDYANPNFAFSVADEKAGASIKITTDGNTNAMKGVKATFDADAKTVKVEADGTVGPLPYLTTQTIWFKPFDFLKVTVGTYDVALNKETIDWTESNTDLGTEGFLLSVDASGFTLDVGLNNGDDAYWITKGKDSDLVLKNTFIKAGYNADFGSIGAYVAFNKTTKWWGSHTNHYLGNLNGKTGIDIGAGYKGAFGGINTFVNVIAYMYDSEMQWIRPEVFVGGGFDAFGFSLFAAPSIYLGDKVKANKEAQCEVVAKLTYGLGGVTPYVYFKDDDVLAKTFASTVKLGATGSVGLMGWNTWVQMDISGSDVAVSVPFELTVSF